MNGVHFNYSNAAPHGAHYRKEKDKKGTGKIGVAKEGMKKTGKLETKGGGCKK